MISIVDCDWCIEWCSIETHRQNEVDLKRLGKYLWEKVVRRRKLWGAIMWRLWWKKTDRDCSIRTKTKRENFIEEGTRKENTEGKKNIDEIIMDD